MYLICFEIDRSGFILEGFRDLGMAEEVAEMVFEKIIDLSFRIFAAHETTEISVKS